MGGNSHAVIHPVTADLVGPHDTLPVETDLVYDPADPYAVTLVFQPGPGEIRWVFGRDLLIRGVHEPSGEGDVRVFPSLDAEGRAVTVVELYSETGQALVELASRDVLAFLAGSVQAVWPGTEVAEEALVAALEASLVESP